MWATIKSVFWTCCAIGVGIFLATAEVEGRTPWQHFQRAWMEHVPPSVDALKAGVKGAIKAASVESGDLPQKENYAVDERELLDRRWVKQASAESVSY
ncbi:MAG TPA: hypothetical protein VEY30_12760 [Myxococcaceae bacterium]|nr:hypothetical protein [Myxococcaceae bacterium]